MCWFVFECVRCASVYDGGCHSSLDYWEVRRGVEGEGLTITIHTHGSAHSIQGQRGVNSGPEITLHEEDFFFFATFTICLLFPSSLLFLPTLLPLLLFWRQIRAGSSRNTSPVSAAMADKALYLGPVNNGMPSVH